MEDTLEDGSNIPYGELNLEAMMKLFETQKFDAVCNLAGVRCLYHRVYESCKKPFCI